MEETKQGLFIVVSAPSGAGKTSILGEFRKIYPEVMFSVSHTTRPPRPGEVDGRDYHFVSETTFRELIAQDEFAEWEENFGCLYGTSGRILASLLSEGRHVLLDIEPRGARSIKDKYDGGVYVFILPTSLSELQRRLLGRGDLPSRITNRLARAAAEIGESNWYDYVIINEHLPLAVDNLRAIYLAEKSRRERMSGKIEDILKVNKG
ncbi:MAG: guanylate kinase [Smithellaceae bacterium]|nr:guanylate kinase [Smithellaceae bacterium]